MYTVKNFKTKKAFKEAVAAQATGGPKITYYQPGPFRGNEPKDGTVFFEGPHYPEPHRWYAQATVENYVVVKVK